MIESNLNCYSSNIEMSDIKHSSIQNGKVVATTTMQGYIPMVLKFTATNNIQKLNT